MHARGVLPCKLELSNPEDSLAVTLCKHEITVGHMLKGHHQLNHCFVKRRHDHMQSYRYKTLFF